jgi:HSP20 family protein
MLQSRYPRPSVTLLDVLFDFDDLFETPKTNSSVKTPIHDVIENDKEFQVEMLLAGVKKDDISIDVNDDVLKIKAERKETKDLKYNRKESYFGKYERSFILSENIKKDNITATFTDGILKIIVPKHNSDSNTTVKRIEIK